MASSQQSIQPSIHISIPKKYTFSIGLFVVVFTFLHWNFDTSSDAIVNTIKFFAALVGVGAAILAAIYVGEGLKETLKQRKESLRAERIAISLSFSQRWNDPSFFQIKTMWREARRELEGKSISAVSEILKEPKKRSAAFEVFNFCEEMAAAVNQGLVDEDNLKRVFRGTIISYYKDLQGWINATRQEKAEEYSDLWIEFEKLYDRWKN